MNLAKLDPLSERNRSKFHPQFASLLAVACMFAATRGTPVAAGTAPAAGEDDPTGETTGDESDLTGETSQPEGATNTATSTGTGTGTGTKEKVNTKTVDEAAANTELVTLIKTYDDVKAKATSYMCDIAEFINKNNLGRPVVIKTLMEARGLTVESAASSASRLMKLAKNPDAIKGLRDGTLNIRETVYNKAPSSNAKANAGTEGGGEGGAGNSGGSKKTDAEKKEDKYNRLLAEFVAIAKECGYSQKDILAGVTATLKDADIK